MSKEINMQNWREPDEVMKVFATLSPTGSSEPITREEWLNRILKPRLSATVPQEVHDLFEVARGALAYGYFFYRLYTLAAEQLSRVGEAAITHKCKALAVPNKIDTFGKRIKWLEDNGVIGPSDAQAWNWIRELRNMGSHPERQMILPPHDAIAILHRVTEQINALFP